MADPNKISTDRRWQAAGIGASLLAVIVLMGALLVAHSRREDPVPVFSSAPLSTQKPKKVVIIGDYFTERRVSDNSNGSNWSELVFRQLRKRGVDIDAESSDEPKSGYLARGLKGITFGQAAHTMLESDDDLVIIVGGSSDASEQPDAVAAAVSDTFALVRKASPHAKLIVAGPIATEPEPGTGVTDVRNVIAEASVKTGATFVDPIGDRWFVGDPALIRDGSPTDAGHTFMAERFMPVVQGALAQTIPWS